MEKQPVINLEWQLNTFLWQFRFWPLSTIKVELRDSLRKK